MYNKRDRQQSVKKKIHIILEYIWRLPSLSELTPMIFNMRLTHLGSEASISLFTSNEGDQLPGLPKSRSIKINPSYP